MDVFAVEWSDESLVELSQDVMGDLVALMLDGLDGLHLFGDTCVVREHLLEGFGSDNDVFGLLGEKVEEALFTRKKALQKSRHLGNSPLRSCVAKPEESSESSSGEARNVV